jgi:hypothetical protein
MRLRAAVWPRYGDGPDTHAPRRGVARYPVAGSQRRYGTCLASSQRGAGQNSGASTPTAGGLLSTLPKQRCAT